MIDSPPAIYSPAITEIDLLRLVKCLAMVEAPDWNRPGGRLQYTHRTWAEETRLPYILAQKQDVAEGIAMARLARIVALCRRFNVEPTVILLASEWNKGTAGAMKRAKTDKWPEHAQRVENLYLDTE
jgi:hypothetical protein